MAINDFIKRSLVTAKIAAHLEPAGICRADGKRPDGAIVMACKSGRVLVWDTTSPGTFAPSHLQLATREAGAVTDQVERRKTAKYIELAAAHHFVPVAIESTGVLDPRHMPSSTSLAIASGRKQGNPYPSTVYTGGLRWPSGGGMQPRCWAPPHPESLT